MLLLHPPRYLIFGLFLFVGSFWASGESRFAGSFVFVYNEARRFFNAAAYCTKEIIWEHYCHPKQRKDYC